MNKILFVVSLVCIFCITASEFMFFDEVTEGVTPKSGIPPLVESCMRKQKTLEKTCTDPAIIRYNLTEFIKHPKLDAQTLKEIQPRMCCMYWDVISCQIRTLPKEPCTPEERKAYIDFIESYEKSQVEPACKQYPRNTTCHA